MVSEIDLFNPLKSPPDLDLAHKHAQANKIGVVNTSKALGVCTCCGLSHNKNDLALWCSTRDFNFIGAGYVLWFSTTFYVAMMLFLLFWISFHKVIVNSQRDFCVETTDTLHPCKEDWIHKYSIANYGPEFDPTYVWLHVVFIILLYIFTGVIKNKMHNESKIIDIETDTAADFSIMVSLLPPDATKEQVTKFFKTKLPDIKVHTVSMGYDVAKLAHLKKERHHIMDKLLNAHSEYFAKHKHSRAEAYVETTNQESNTLLTPKANRNSNMPRSPNDHAFERQITISTINDPAFKELETKLNEVTQQIKEEQDKIMDNHSEYFTGIAFVSFEKMEMADQYVQAYRMSNLHWFIRGCKYKLRYPDDHNNLAKIRIQAAPEADEILWDNLRFKFRDQMKWKALTGLIVALILLITFSVIVGIKYGKFSIKHGYYGHVITKLNDKGQEVDKYEHPLNSKQYGVLQLISILIFVVCKITNKIFDHIVTDLTVLEKHYSVGVFYTSAVAKTAISQFVNTSVLIVIAHYILNDEHDRKVIWGFESLIVDIWYLLIFNAAIVPLLHLINFHWIAKVIKRCKLKRNRHTKVYTQQQAHNIVEGPSMNAIKCYTDTYQLFLTGLFFQPAFPLSAGILCVSQVLMYWIEKFYLLRVYSLPKLVQDLVTMESLVFLKVGAFVLSASHLYFDVLMSEHQQHPHVLTIAMTCITFVLIFIPIEDAFLHVYTYTGEEAEIKKHVTYESASVNFITDYNLSNPVTREKFREEHIKRATIQAGELDQAELKHLNEDEHVEVQIQSGLPQFNEHGSPNYSVPAELRIQGHIGSDKQSIPSQKKVFIREIHIADSNFGHQE